MIYHDESNWIDFFVFRDTRFCDTNNSFEGSAQVVCSQAQIQEEWAEKTGMRNVIIWKSLSWFWDNRNGS